MIFHRKIAKYSFDFHQIEVVRFWNERLKFTVFKLLSMNWTINSIDFWLFFAYFEKKRLRDVYALFTAFKCTLNSHNRIRMLNKHELNHSRMSPILHHSDHMSLAFIWNVLRARTHTHNVITHSLTHFSFVWLSEHAGTDCIATTEFIEILLCILHYMESKSLWDWRGMALQVFCSILFFAILLFQRKESVAVDIE